MRARFSLVSLISLLIVSGVSGCDRTTAQEHLERANGYVAKNEVRSVIIELKNALQKDPNLAAARLALGEVDLKIGDFASAEKELEKALDLGIDRNQVMPPLLEAKLESGRFQEVLGALEQLEPSARVEVIRGRAQLLAGEPLPATAAFRRALDADPKSAMAYVGLAQIALTGNDPTQAAALLTQAIAADPLSRRALLAQGNLQILRSQLDDAKGSFEAAARVPGFDLIPEFGVVQVLILQNKLDDANTAVDKLLVQAPKNPMANYFKGMIAFQKQDLAQAEQSLRVVLQQAPDHPQTLLLLGAVKFRQGQFAEAESEVGRALSFEPNNVSALRLLAAIRLSNDNAKGAIEALEPVIASLHDAPSLALLGSAYLRAGVGDKATSYLQQAVELSPDVAGLRTQLALSMMATGDNKEAVAQLQTAIGLDDRLIQSDVLLILLRLKAGNIDEAGAAARALTEHDPKSPIGFNLLGAVNLAKKDEKAAAAAFERSLALDPGYSPAALNLAKMALAKGDAPGARARLKTLTDHDPTNVAVLSALAQMAVADGDWKTAKDYLERARSAHPDAVAPRIELARLALSANDLELAQTVSAEALAVDPDNFDALAVHAQTLILLGNSGVAERDVNKLHMLVAQPNVDLKLLIAVAALERQLGQNDRARENLLRAVEQSEESQDARIALIQVEALRGDEKAAKAHLDKLRKLGADATLLAVIEGDISAATGDFAEAAGAYRGPARAGNRDATMKLADALQRSGKNAEAKQTMEGYLKEHPDDFAVELVLASFVLKEGDRGAALKRYEALNTKRADSPPVLNNLAWLYFENKDPRAVEMARRASKLAPRNAEIADTLGWILVQQQETTATEGLQYLELASNLRPNDASIQYHLASAYERLNRRTEARRAIDHSLESGEFPERADAVALRARL